MNHEGRIDAAGFLRGHGILPRHRLGQNFLEDRGALEQIARAAGIEADDTVLEIGSGFGSLTLLLAAKAARVVAIEVDPRLVELAADYLRGHSNVDLVCGDILELPPASLGLVPGYITAANIPYYVTSPILRHLLESSPRPRRVVLTIQEEVARRACGSPPHMSLLALSVQVYGAARLVGNIRRGAFYPEPNVDSAILQIDAYDTPLIAPSRLPIFFRIAKGCFMHRRKMLRNSLAQGVNTSVDRASAMLLRAGIDPGRRAQTLSLAEWGALTEEAAASRA